MPLYAVLLLIAAIYFVATERPIRALLILVIGAFTI
jgi:hypothetical protein